MRLKHYYLALMLIGMIVPYYFFAMFLVNHGLDGKLFLQQLFGTPISTFFAADLILSSWVFLVFIGRESRRHAIHRQWPFLIALFTVGLSFALPLFLYVRQRRIDAEATS